MRSTPPAGSSDLDMAARAAWLHFVGGLTQSEVARRLGVPTTRAHRYIARAQSDGLVRVFVDVQAGDCVALETALIQRFGLSHCRVAMDVPETGPLPLRTLSAAGADFLMQAAARGEHDVIGVGHGRTLSASVDAMGRVESTRARFVSVLGGLTRTYAANPYDVIYRLAQKTGAEAYMLPVPMFAKSAADKQVLLAQPGLDTITRLIDEATLIVLGIGEAVGSAREAIAANMADPHGAEAGQLQRAAAEILGQFLDERGRVLELVGRDRAMAPALDTLVGRDVVAIAGGLSKAPAIRAALASGLLTGLIIDEATARAVVGEPAPSAGPGNL